MVNLHIRCAVLDSDIFDDMIQIKNLPKGATAIYYAYMIHTEIGNKMVAAKVLFFCSISYSFITGGLLKSKDNKFNV